MIGDSEKMSKSKRNTVAPQEIFDAYGVDAARFFVLSDSACPSGTCSGPPAACRAPGDA